MREWGKILDSLKERMVDMTAVVKGVLTWLPLPVRHLIGYPIVRIAPSLELKPTLELSGEPHRMVRAAIRIALAVVVTIKLLSYTGSLIPVVVVGVLASPAITALVAGAFVIKAGVGALQVAMVTGEVVLMVKAAIAAVVAYQCFEKYTTPIPIPPTVLGFRGFFEGFVITPLVRFITHDICNFT
jgi:hypothetical protein